jgi:hypothetical protein
VEPTAERPSDPVPDKVSTPQGDGRADGIAPAPSAAGETEPEKPAKPTAAKPVPSEIKASASESPGENFGPAVVAPAPVLDAEPAVEERERPVPIRLPDDPGVDGDESMAEPRRFRLF